MRPLRYSLAALLLLTPACASTGSEPPVRRAGNGATISAEEVRHSKQSNTAYELVSSLRPSWLWRSRRSPLHPRETVQVYQDGVRLGGLEELRRIPAATVESITLLDGPGATQRFGTDHGSGAILIRSHGSG